MSDMAAKKEVINQIALGIMADLGTKGKGYNTEQIVTACALIVAGGVNLLGEDRVELLSINSHDDGRVMVVVERVIEGMEDKTA